MEEIKKTVQKVYTKIAEQGTFCCAPQSCCGGTVTAESISNSIGYSESDLERVPEGANMGLGCGNPLAFAEIKKGDAVLDLGSGAGIDCFLAASRTGSTGRVIGVDMTPAMLEKARANAERGGFNNVEFRQGEIENLPVSDNSVDLIISNCVVNLSPDKDTVFREAFRVLKAGGKIMISDIVLSAALPEDIRKSAEAYTGCIAGAMLKEDYLASIRRAGFRDIAIIEESRFPVEWARVLPLPDGVSLDSVEKAVKAVLSVRVKATK